MALSFENNRLMLHDKYLELPDNIIEAIQIHNFVILFIDYQYDKLTKKFNYEGGNVFCYDDNGSFKWQWKSKSVMRIWIEKNELHIYDTSSLGYDCVVDVETGDIIKMKPTK